MTAAPDIGTAAMPALRIVAFTRAELVANPGKLHSYDDPHGYLRSYNQAGIGRLADNPHGRDDDLALVLAIDDRTVVGRLALYGGPAPADSPEQRLLWLSGYFLQDDYRRTGAGGMLMLRVLSTRRQLLAAGGPSPELRKLYDSTGFVRLPRLTGFFHFYDPRMILRRYVRQRWLRSLLYPAAKLATALYGFVRRRKPDPAVSFSPCESLGPWVGELMASDRNTLFARDHALLTWVLEYSRTARAFEISRGDQRIGYCVLGKRRLPSEPGSQEPSAGELGLLIDHYLIESERATFGSILAFARRTFADRHTDAFFCQGSDPDLAVACRWAGMLPYGGSYVFYRLGPRYKIDAGRAWRLTNATADLTLQAD